MFKDARGFYLPIHIQENVLRLRMAHQIVCSIPIFAVDLFDEFRSFFFIGGFLIDMSQFYVFSCPSVIKGRIILRRMAGIAKDTVVKPAITHGA